MSVSIHWEPYRPAARRLTTTTPNEFIRCIQRAFGDRRILTPDDLPTVAGMAAVEGKFDELFRLLSENGSIRIWES